MKVTKGQLLALTEGEYSDYCLTGHVVALQDFSLEEIAARFKASEKDDAYYYGQHDRFVAWLIRNGLVEPSDTVLELYLGSYGRLNPDLIERKLEV